MGANARHNWDHLGRAAGTVTQFDSFDLSQGSASKAKQCQGGRSGLPPLCGRSAMAERSEHVAIQLQERDRNWTLTLQPSRSLFFPENSLLKCKKTCLYLWPIISSGLACHEIDVKEQHCIKEPLKMATDKPPNPL